MIKQLLTAIFAMTLSMNALAQNKEVNVWPKKLPADVKLEKGKLQQTMGDDDILRINKVPMPTLQKFPVKNILQNYLNKSLILVLNSNLKKLNQ